jgi:membrane protein implicated in regulation of membrane protease activity
MSNPLKETPIQPYSRSFDNEAVVCEVIQQGKIWQVKYEGTWWIARSPQPAILNPGDVVYVVGRQRITLIIHP